MQLIKQTVQANFNLFLFGDDHEGSVLTYKKGREKLFDMLESPWGGLTAKHNYGWHHGDHIEGITVDDKRYDPKTCKQAIPDEQNESWIEIWKPVRHKLIGMNDGNHPWKLFKYGNLTERACKNLGIHYGGWIAKVEWLDSRGSLILKSLHIHGARSINSVSPDTKRRKANMEHILRRHLEGLAGDTILMAKGHTHKLIAVKPEPELYLVNEGIHIRQNYTNAAYPQSYFPMRSIQEAHPVTGYIHPDNRHYVNTGSFLRSMMEGIVSYAERAEYGPVELGFAIAMIRDRQIVDVKKVVL